MAAAPQIVDDVAVAVAVAVAIVVVGFWCCDRLWAIDVLSEIRRLAMMDAVIVAGGRLRTQHNRLSQKISIWLR